MTPSGPLYAQTVAKMEDIKAKRMAKGWKYPSKVPVRAASPQRSTATLPGERSEKVVAHIEERRETLKQSGAMSYETWVAEKKRQSRERFDYFKALMDAEVATRREEKLRTTERQLYYLELERGWPSRIFEAVPAPGTYAPSPELMRYAKKKYTVVNGRCVTLWLRPARCMQPTTLAMGACGAYAIAEIAAIAEVLHAVLPRHAAEAGALLLLTPSAPSMHRRESSKDPLSPYTSAIQVPGAERSLTNVKAPSKEASAAAPAESGPIALSKPALVICGPSGVGKGTLQHLALRRAAWHVPLPHCFVFA